MKYAVGLCCLAAFAVQAMAQNPITLRCDPVGGATVTGNDTVIVDCFVVSNGAAITLNGTQLDLDCNIACSLGGTIDTTDPSGQGMFIDTARPDYMFPAGFAVVNEMNCTMAPSLGVSMAPTLPAGATRYVGSIEMLVSDCALGLCPFVLENRSSPPIAADQTKVRDNTNALVAFDVDVFDFDVPDGTCCNGLICIVDAVNEYCCLNTIPLANSWGEGKTCLGPNPCACETDNQCPDASACTVDRCVAGNCTHTPSNCSDGDGCTLDLCDPTVTTLLSDINGTGCYNDPDPAIDDGTLCTVDSCNPATGVISHTPRDCGDPIGCTIDTCTETVGGCPLGAYDAATGCCITDINDVPCGVVGDCPAGALDCLAGFCVCLECSPTALVPRKADDGSNCHDEGDMVFIDVAIPASTQTIAGGQFRITYDPSCLDLVSASCSASYSCSTLADCPAGYTGCGPVAGQVLGVCTGKDPWTEMIFSDINEAAGLIFIACGVPPTLEQGKGTSAAGTMATLKFNKVGTCNECDACLTDVNPQHTMLTTSKGDRIDLCGFDCTKPIRDRGETTVSCPGDLLLNSDCDAVTTTAAWACASASNTCDGALDMDCSCVHEPPQICSIGGATCSILEVVNDSCGPLGAGVCNPKFAPIDCGDRLCGGLLAQGRYTYTCGVEAASCPEDTEGCSWTVTVSDQTTLDVVVQLSPNLVNNEFDRCICFELYTSCSPEKFVEDCETLTFGGPFDIRGHFDGDIKVPKVGNLACLTARDRQHSLRSVDVDVTCESGHYHAVFKGDPFLGGNWLIQGNLNRDRIIDILDFGTLLGQINQNPTPPKDKNCDDNDGDGFTHADMNADGFTDVGDYTFVQINFLANDKTTGDCCTDNGAAPVIEGRTSISVKELRAMGLEDLIVADLNNDGVVDTDDMAAFAQGARPKAAGKNRGSVGRPSRAGR